MHPAQSTSIFRPPYSSTNQEVTDSTWTAIRAAADDGYLTVLSTDDSRDWTRPGAAQIVANSKPDGTAGEVLLMHDGGGDRSQTVEALRSLLPELQADGYDVTTVSDAIGLAGTMQPTSFLDRIAGTALITGVQLSELVMAIITDRPARDRRDHPPARRPRHRRSGAPRSHRRQPARRDDRLGSGHV